MAVTTCGVAGQDVEEDRDVVCAEVPQRVDVVADRAERGADAVDVLHATELATRHEVADGGDAAL